MDSIFGVLMFGTAGAAIVIAAGYYNGSLSRDVIVHCGLLARQQLSQVCDYVYKKPASPGPRTLRKPSQSTGVPRVQISEDASDSSNYRLDVPPKEKLTNSPAYEDIKSFQDSLTESTIQE